MAWITPTREDLIATISADEVSAFEASSDFADAVGGILARTVAFVRGFVKAGRAGVDEDPRTIPAALLAPAMDYAAFDLLKRFNIPVSEDRRRARQDALNIFVKVAERSLSIDSAADAASPDETPAAPSSTAPTPPRLLD